MSRARAWAPRSHARSGGSWARAVGLVWWVGSVAATPFAVGGPAQAQDAGVEPNPYRDAAEAAGRQGPVDAGIAGTEPDAATRPGVDAGGAPASEGEADLAGRDPRDDAGDVDGEPAADAPPADADAAPTSAIDGEPPRPTRDVASGDTAPRDPDSGWPNFIPVPVPTASEGSDGIGRTLRELVPVLPASRTGSAFGLVMAVFFAAVMASITRRIREALPTRGVFPRLLQLAHVALRLLVVGLGVALLVSLLPLWMGPALPWVLLAAAAAIGWSARDLLPDVVAGIVVLFERRIRRGVWLAGEGFSGTVIGVGLRATWLVDPRGHRIAVPNRHLLSGPIVSDRAVGAEHEVTLRMESAYPASQVRQALLDAVLQSPWVPPGAAPVVLRDPDQPHLWRVRSRLLEARYAPRFEGELLERAEEILAAAPSSTFPLDEELDDA
jgi:hypothetical protein